MGKRLFKLWIGLSIGMLVWFVFDYNFGHMIPDVFGNPTERLTGKQTMDRIYFQGIALLIAYWVLRPGKQAKLVE